MLRVVEAIVAARPVRVSFSGGEPLLVPWWAEAAQGFRRAGIPVTLFTGGWLMDDDKARQLAESTTGVSVSIDGPSSAIHDRIRGRHGSFDRAMAALAVLSRHKVEREVHGEPCYRLGIEYTVTRSGRDGLDQFVEEVTTRFPGIDYVTFGAVVPEGLAQEEHFASSELLDDRELIELQDSELRLAARASYRTSVSVTDARYFLPSSPLRAASEGIAHIEPDGEFRAFTNYEAKVGNILREPVDVLWARALAWRNDAFVREQMDSIRSLSDWARVTRVLDRRYGSDNDKARIAKRQNSGTVPHPVPNLAS
jgi:MoaA/NifB/PqqE/SkfB family radical SAM enzyme